MLTLLGSVMLNAGWPLSSRTLATFPGRDEAACRESHLFITCKNGGGTPGNGRRRRVHRWRPCHVTWSGRWQSPVHIQGARTGGTPGASQDQGLTFRFCYKWLAALAR